ncbi:Small acidic protein, partial [Halocaridina rubra]
ESDDEASCNTNKEKGGLQPTNDVSHSSGMHQHTSSSSSQECLKNQNDTKDGQRSSLQERLLGIASGGRRPSHDDHGGSASRKESRSSPSRSKDDSNHKKSRSKSRSPKHKSPRPKSPSHSNSKSSRRRTRSRSRSRERDAGRSTQSNRDHSSRGHSGQGHSSRSRDSRDSRRSRDEDRKRRDDERRGRRSRSRSRSRERRRSRSRSRDRRSRSRSRERRRRSRSHERKRPMDIRKEAQQKLAALKAANPDLTAAELMRRSMEAQVEEVKKQTGITLPSYYNPATMNPLKFAEQERKKKLLWGNKAKQTEGVVSSGCSSLYGSLVLNNTAPSIGGTTLPPSSPISPNSASGGQASLWASTRFVNDKDGKMAEKFRRLMGVKDGGSESAASTSSTVSSVSGSSSSSSSKSVDLLQKQETMFTSMERQYEMARLATHTHKGFGLGFTSQSFMPK